MEIKQRNMLKLFVIAVMAVVMILMAAQITALQDENAMLKSLIVTEPEQVRERIVTAEGTLDVIQDKLEGGQRVIDARYGQYIAVCDLCGEEGVECATYPDAVKNVKQSGWSSRYLKDRGEWCDMCTDCSDI